MMVMVMIDLDKINAAFEKCDFVAWDYGELRDCDDFYRSYKRFKVHFAIPNGGIIGVSALWPAMRLGWQCPSESLEYPGENDGDRYYDEAWHFSLAKKAIDAAISACPEAFEPKRRRIAGDQLAFDFSACTAPLDISEPLPVFRQPEPVVPVAPLHSFKVGDRVCHNRAWQGKAGTVLEVRGDLVFVDFDRRSYPYPALARSLRHADEFEVELADSCDIYPDEDDCYETRRLSNAEWRYTGTMGAFVALRDKYLQGRLRKGEYLFPASKLIMEKAEF